MLFSTLITLALPLSTLAAPSGMRRVSRRAVNKMPAEAAVSSQNGVLKPYKRAAVDVKNGQDAIALNKQFASIKAGDACTAGQDACAGDKFAQCVGDKYVAQPCAATLVCAALPNIGSAGTSIACTTASDRDARIAATGATAGAASPPPAKTTAAAPPPDNTAAAPPPDNNNAGGGAATGGADGDLQKSLTLDPSVIQTGFQNDGQQPPVDGQFPSLTSFNNFINFCAKTLPATPLTNGQQITSGSCNGAPIGLIPSTAKMPSSKFTFPKNLDTITANQNFTLKMVLKNVDAGHFTNAKENYFAAPQQLNADGVIIGHTHVVIETIPSLTSTTATDPNTFVFFKGINTGLDAEGQVSTLVGSAKTPGVPAGTYRLCSMNAAMNHQPVIVPIAQHGNLDDCVYFTAK